VLFNRIEYIAESQKMCSKHQIVRLSGSNSLIAHDDYFWKDTFGGHLKSFESSVMVGLYLASEHTEHYKASPQLFKSNQLVDCNKP